MSQRIAGGFATPRDFSLQSQAILRAQDRIRTAETTAAELQHRLNVAQERISTTTADRDGLQEQLERANARIHVQHEKEALLTIALKSAERRAQELELRLHEACEALTFAEDRVIQSDAANANSTNSLLWEEATARHVMQLSRRQWLGAHLHAF
eukprot:CAMPEP_0183335606 /NCGR_PEP_ID=MMETSP0164_2-20130417/3857_1 /TAXON_ID=221442 /ORGANISM="Coccolithus pelagicus ssp braarudi, Strain PLY182g" /LENGTH=153 /DNA_ID=CAMNT_0025504999 /DNA_START=59 /DNA_END=523 /DNA_ORIENTATION=+